MRRVRGMRLLAVAAVGGLALTVAACGKPPAESGSGNNGAASGKKIKACMVTDIGGIDDRSFNASAWKGMQEANKANSNVTVSNVTSKAEADYEPNLNNLIQQKCDLVLAVGGLMKDATEKIAKNNPKTQFAIVDAKIDLPNVYSMQFNTAQSSFQAGYLAAAQSKSAKVATYGGLKIPPVTIFMDGFAEGVAYFNKTKSKNVQVLGWDPAKQEGTFAQSFIDQAKGKSITEQFVTQGADIVFPVAGGTGLGSGAVAKEKGVDKLSVIWVDVDGCESAKDYCSTFLTTVVKNIPDAVKDGLLKASKEEKTTSFTGTLQNKGTSLAPYHDFESKVTPDLKKEVEALKADIESGKIKIESKAQPTG